jgi:hypothetical protein
MINDNEDHKRHCQLYAEHSFGSKEKKLEIEMHRLYLMKRLLLGRPDIVNITE